MNLKPICRRLILCLEWSVFYKLLLLFLKAVPSLQSWKIDCLKEHVEFMYTNVARNHLKYKGCYILDIVAYSIEGFVNVILKKKSNADPLL
jgi:hypothetical protein